MVQNNSLLVEYSGFMKFRMKLFRLKLYFPYQIVKGDYRIVICISKTNANINLYIQISKLLSVLAHFNKLTERRPGSNKRAVD